MTTKPFIPILSPRDLFSKPWNVEMRMNRYSILATDFSHLAMVEGLWRDNLHEQEAVYHLTFSTYPFENDYLLSCGLHHLFMYLRNWVITDEDVNYLSSILGSDGDAFFDPGFLRYLKEIKFTCDVDAVPEGVLVFPHEPLIRVSGPLIQCQLLESMITNLLYYNSLIATKASMLYQVMRGDMFYEAGFQYVPGPIASYMASRSAYIGGSDATSNVLAGKLFNIPMTAAISHNWVLAHADEETT